MQLTKILFIDIDGTLTTTISGNNFKQNPYDIRPLPGSQEAINYFSNLGFKIFGISNQGGCDTINKKTGKIIKTIPDAILEMRNTIALFPQIEAIYFCPSMKGDECIRVSEKWIESSSTHTSGDGNFFHGTFRKPNIGMINLIENEAATQNNVSNLDREHSLFVGDSPEDKECALAADIPFRWAAYWRNEFIK